MYQAAIYMRLSKDDGKSESVSISSQRKLLTNFAEENNFAIADEYVDDGYSGTSFDRPEFKRMIADIERGKINMVITKDLSRLGRDYIISGQYTEIYFPSKNVRYIAVNDGYDTAMPYNDIAPFKNVINEMYARDISKKIRSSFYARMKDGCYIGNFAPYGYEKDCDDNGHLVVDEAVRAVIEIIFVMGAENYSGRQIAEYLNNSHTDPPIVYRCKKYGKSLDNYSECKKHIWTASTVNKILKNQVYIGNTVQHKTEKLSLKIKRSVRVPNDRQIIVKNTHEPIILKTIFDKVQQNIAKRTCKK